MEKMVHAYRIQYQGYECSYNDVKFGDAVPNIGFLAREGTEKEEDCWFHTKFSFCIILHVQGYIFVQFIIPVT